MSCPPPAALHLASLTSRVCVWVGLCCGVCVCVCVCVCVWCVCVLCGVVFMCECGGGWFVLWSSGDFLHDRCLFMIGRNAFRVIFYNCHEVKKEQ